MKMQRFAASIALLAAMMFSPLAVGQTADEIVAKYIVARGGANKIDALKTIRLTGSLDLAPGVTGTLIQEQKRDNLMRMDMIANLGGGEIHAVRAYDGKNGWVFLPQMGDTAPRPMREDELKDALEESDFCGPLVDYQKKGHTIELLGREAVDGHDCFKLKVVLKTGEARLHYLDCETFLESRVEGENDGAKFAQTLSDYKAVDGIMIPHRSVVEVQSAKNPPQKFVFAVEKAEVNPKIEDEHFAMPKEAPAIPSKDSRKDAPATQPANDQSGK